MIRRIVLSLLLLSAAGVTIVLVVTLYRGRIVMRNSAGGIYQSTNSGGIPEWDRAVEQVKADRGEPMGASAVVETPPELKHYSERYWFLATQVAEIAKHNIHTCQNYRDLAFMIQSGELIPVPAVSETYVLYGVGERADESEFTSHDDSDSSFYDYASLKTLAKDLGGRSYDLENAFDRQSMKVHMLSSLRPEALKVLEEVASAYHRQFARQLPVSSLVRPEQYQRALHKVNRNAILIETPPHSTGLAFDIDYRYMSGAEQAFVMTELARLKNEGRIEVIRERNANYHIFAFLHGSRPSDDLIAASLDEARPDAPVAHHAQRHPAVKKKKPAVKKKVGRARATVRKRRN